MRRDSESGWLLCPPAPHERSSHLQLLDISLSVISQHSKMDECHEMKWRRIEGSCPPCIKNHTATRVGSSLYVVGGHDDTEWMDSVQRYDAVGDRWEAVAPMSARRAGHAVAVSGGSDRGDPADDQRAGDDFARADPVIVAVAIALGIGRGGGGEGHGARGSGAQGGGGASWLRQAEFYGEIWRLNGNTECVLYTEFKPHHF